MFKYVKNFKSFIYESTLVEDSILTYEMLKPYLIDGKYLYHYTLKNNLDSILKEGLIPKKNPNSYYHTSATNAGAIGIFLTTSDSLYNTNLPESLMDEMDEFYDEYGDDDYNESDKPIVRLTVDISNLDIKKFIWDDDYLEDTEGWNKATKYADKIIESLDRWRSIAYLGIIPPSNIIGYDYDYYA